MKYVRVCIKKKKFFLYLQKQFLIKKGLERKATGINRLYKNVALLCKFI